MGCSSPAPACGCLPPKLPASCSSPSANRSSRGSPRESLCPPTSALWLARSGRYGPMTRGIPAKNARTFKAAARDRFHDNIEAFSQAAGNDLSFTTCHMCEAKWWYKGGELVPLASVIGVVSTKA